MGVLRVHSHFVLFCAFGKAGRGVLTPFSFLIVAPKGEYLSNVRKGMRKIMAQRIVFYGDSNTWGYLPGGSRMARDKRFPQIVAKMLPDAFAIEEGLNGRNAAFSHMESEYELLGGATFEKIFTADLPCDALVIMLGTNDVFPPLNHSADMICENLGRIIHIAKTHAPKSKILLVSPVPLHPYVIRMSMADGYGVQEILEQDLSRPMQELAERENVDFLNAGEFVPHADASDGVHLAEAAHAILGKVIGEKLKNMLGLSIR